MDDDSGKGVSEAPAASLGKNTPPAEPRALLKSVASSRATPSTKLGFSMGLLLSISIGFRI